MPVQSCGRSAVDAGSAGISNPSAEAAAALQKEREALLAELSRLQAEEERVIAKLDKVEEAIAAAVVPAAGGQEGFAATQKDLKAGAGEGGHHSHAAEHASGGMSAAIKRSIGRAVESFAQGDAKDEAGHSRHATMARECADQKEPHGRDAERTTAAGTSKKAGSSGTGKGGRAGRVHPEQTADTGRAADKTAGADSNNPFADLQAALNAFDRTF